jgi:hypothetical protein
MLPTIRDCVRLRSDRIERLARILVGVNGEPASPYGGGPRWQYVILWRYGALGLAMTGVAMIGVGASGVAGVPISLALLPLGFASLIAGVILPRIEGKFTAGSSGVSAELLAVHKLDILSFTASAPALATADGHGQLDGDETGDITPGLTAEAIKLGDVWEALELAGFQVTQAGMSKAFLEGPQGRSIGLHVPEALGWATASDDLVAQLATWDIRPVASGRYPIPPDVPLAGAAYPYSGILPRMLK